MALGSKWVGSAAAVPRQEGCQGNALEPGDEVAQPLAAVRRRGPGDALRRHRGTRWRSAARGRTLRGLGRRGTLPPPYAPQGWPAARTPEPTPRRLASGTPLAGRFEAGRERLGLVQDERVVEQAQRLQGRSRRDALGRGQGTVGAVELAQQLGLHGAGMLVVHRAAVGRGGELCQGIVRGYIVDRCSGTAGNRGPPIVRSKFPLVARIASRTSSALKRRGGNRQRYAPSRSIRAACSRYRPAWR